MSDEVDPQDVFDRVERFAVRSTKQRFSGHVINVRTDLVEMPDGDAAERDIVVHPGAVGVIVLDAQERVLLVQQYRHGPHQLLWEPPAGLLDADAAGRSAQDNAARELYEEAGYRASDWRVLIDLYTSPGMSDEAVRVYLARGVTAVDEDDRHVGQHEEADMPFSWVPLDVAVTKVLAGELHNPLAVSGILATAAAKARGFESLRAADAVWPARPEPTGASPATDEQADQSATELADEATGGEDAPGGEPDDVSDDTAAGKPINT